MNFKKILLIFILLGSTIDLLAQGGYLAQPDKDLLRIKAPLDSFNRRLPVEKVYLHLDKPYYNTGDTLWFKSYLLDGVNFTPSKLSGLLYIELIDDSTEVSRRICVPVKDGLSWGQIPLPKTIFHEGGYTMRAYTSWMENFGSDYIFTQRFYIGIPSEQTWLVQSAAALNSVADKKELQVMLKLTHTDNLRSPVALKQVEVKIYDQSHYVYNEVMQTGLDGSLKLSQVLKDKARANKVRVQITSLDKSDNYKIVQVPLNLSRDQNIDLQFLPEGGKLVNGQRSIVGFKAVGEDGKSQAVLGAVYDSKGTEVASFASAHNGMGSFEFTPKAGETYTAKMIKPAVKPFTFPKIALAGTTLHVTNPEQDDKLTINFGGLDKLPTDTACYIIGTSRGVIYYSQKIDLAQPQIIVNKRSFPSGVTRFTLFKGKIPLNERAVFIDNHDGLNIRITLNKTTYRKRDSVGLSIEVKDKSGFPVQGSFSMAVTDDSQVRPDSLGNYSMNAGLLLNADLKGNIEDPGYYINRKDKQAWVALDNLVLTQGWTGYDWKDIFAPASKPEYQVEKKLVVTGKVTNLGNKPVKNAPVLVSSQKPRFITTGVTDSAGIYQFANLPNIDSGSFFIQARNAKDKKLIFGNVSVNRFKALPIPEDLNSSILPWYVNADPVQLNYVKRKAEAANDANLKLTGIQLKEVKIRSNKIIQGSFNRNGPGKADLIFDEQDIKESGVMNLYQLIKQKLPGLKVAYHEGIASLMLNNYMVVIEIDGGGLPIMMDSPYTTEQLLDELNDFSIVSYKGMEVMYNRKYMYNYGKPPSTAHFKGQEIENSRLLFEGLGGIPNVPPPPKDYFYASGYQPGYLEKRVNVLSNSTREIAVISITTANKVGYNRNLSPDVAIYRPLPIMYPQQFYRPKYNVAPGSVTVPDYRATIHWEPNITTDQNGRAKVSFYTSDIAAKYTVIVSGADVTGWIGDAQIKINPQKP
ncbi:MAG: hypothetical protein V4553_08045 [Bacteroidota bacterium]